MSFLNVIQKSRSVIAMDETILLMYKWASFPIYLKDEDDFFLVLSKALRDIKVMC